MKEMRNLHLRVQEMCDCYATSDPLQEMAKMADDREDTQESAVKWLALAMLHGINNNAEKIVIQRDREGRVVVKAEYRKTELPAPNTAIADTIIETMREITHIEDKGKLPLSVGIRDSSINLKAKIESKEDRHELKLEFE